MGWSIETKLMKARNFISKLASGISRLGLSGYIKFAVKEQVYNYKGRKTISYEEYIHVARYTHIELEAIRERSRKNNVNVPSFLIIVVHIAGGRHLLNKTVSSIKNQICINHRMAFVFYDETQARKYDSYINQIDPQDNSIPESIIFRDNNINDLIGKNSREYLLIIKSGDVLAIEALEHITEKILQGVDVKVIYYDHDELSIDQERSSPKFKPDISLRYLEQKNYIGRACCFASKWVLDQGGFSGVSLENMMHRMLLNLSTHSSRAVHIPRILLHCNEYEAVGSWNQNFVNKKADSGQGDEYTIESRIDHRMKILLEGEIGPSVSVIIPIKDKIGLLKELLNSIDSYRKYENSEIIIIDNGSTETQTYNYLAEIRQRDGVRIIGDHGEFNFSRLNNTAANESSGEYLLLLNNDTEVIHDDWIEHMLAVAMEPGVGAVGAMLFYPDGDIQHLGVSIRGGVHHTYRGTPYEDLCIARDDSIYYRHEVSCVTAACFMIKKDLYIQLGGMNETRYPIAFNDVDICLRIRKLGYENILEPKTKLIHKESRSRGYGINPVEYLNMVSDWDIENYRDPYLNENICIDKKNMKLCSAPYKYNA